MTASFKILLKKEILTDDEFDRLTQKWITWLEWYYDTYKNIFKIPINSEFNFRSRNIVYQNIPLTWKIDKIESFNSSNLNIDNHHNSLTNIEETWQQLWQLAFFKEDIVLIDYKTWKSKTIWIIKWTDRFWNKKESWSEWKYFRQLLFYKLMCEQDRDFRNNYWNISLAIDFVEWKNWKYKYLEIDYTSEDFEEFKTLVKDTWKQINDINFWREELK
jgi:hypothetical protein